MAKLQNHIQYNKNLVFFLLLQIFLSTLIYGQTKTYEDAVPKVYLNHFFLIIDSATYKDIVESEYIKNEFAALEERTTVSNNNESWTGAYIYGESTYIEFFDSSKNPMPPGITSGIAFGVDNKGEIKIVQKKLKEYKNAPFSLRTRDVEGIQVPWFYITLVFYGKTDSNIVTWVMEYHEDYLKKLYPDLALISTGITRKNYLKTYAARMTKPGHKRSKIFKDVIEVNLSLNEQDSERLMGELTVFGYETIHDGNKKICKGPDVQFIIEVVDEGKGRITGIKMSLHHNLYERKSYKFGEKSKLILHDNKTATWKF